MECRIWRLPSRPCFSLFTTVWVTWVYVFFCTLPPAPPTRRDVTSSFTWPHTHRPTVPGLCLLTYLLARCTYYGRLRVCHCHMYDLTCYRHRLLCWTVLTITTGQITETLKQWSVGGPAGLAGTLTHARHKDTEARPVQYTVYTT